MIALAISLTRWIEVTTSSMRRWLDRPESVLRRLPRQSRDPVPRPCGHYCGVQGQTQRTLAYSILPLQDAPVGAGVILPHPGQFHAGTIQCDGLCLSFQVRMG